MVELVGIGRIGGRGRRDGPQEDAEETAKAEGKTVKEIGS